MCILIFPLKNLDKKNTHYPWPTDNVTIQCGSYYNIIDCIPCAVLYIPMTIFNFQFVLLNPFTFFT